LKQRTLLLVEDNKGCRKAFSRALKHQGWYVLEASTVSGAIGHLDGLSVDVVLTDYCLSSEKTGIDVVLHAQRKGIPCVLWSGDPHSVPSTPGRMDAVTTVYDKVLGLTPSSPVTRLLAELVENQTIQYGDGVKTVRAGGG